MSSDECVLECCLLPLPEVATGLVDQKARGLTGLFLLVCSAVAGGARSHVLRVHAVNTSAHSLVRVPPLRL